ncbi:phosphatase PAP2 family protein [Streptomyces sp. NP-1717]|uniref:phosphatase PAP2 family protein n=1 Tax=unclassified Streptomyces TaxID=2593676 RepID=UPI001F5D1D84|nr:phosphatase PAP2 family protein [Streptomyces sp. NP-1717]MCI3226518.1 phosphatase PAP2 family protein [Streptomyces sp. NP-1717]WTA73505.1 phosphatase PAP2 family protein [Streptomyces sp. NBC_00838]
MPQTVHARTAHRPRWWAELLLLVVVYGAYSAGRLLARGDVSTAVDHGLAILRIEKAFFLNAEHPLNRLFTSTPAIGIPADFAYASLHYLVTPAVLIWLFRRRPARYRAARTWLMLSTLLGLIGFTLLPTCPPRLLDASYGFVDTMAQYSSYGWWGAEASAPRGLGGMTNQYAAMPSLHVGWALWCGVLLWRHGRTPLMRVLGVVYPLLTVIVVMGTANHYFLDAVAGGLVMGAGALLTGPAMRAADRVWTRAADRYAFVDGFTRPPLAAGSGTGSVPGQRRQSVAVVKPTVVKSTVTKSTVANASGTSRVGKSPVKPPNVSDGCETSAGERFPGQRTRTNSSAGTPGSTGAATDDAPAKTR